MISCSVGAMMSGGENNVTVETREDTEESERMVIIGTDEIEVHPDLSTAQPSGKFPLRHKVALHISALN